MGDLSTTFQGQLQSRATALGGQASSTLKAQTGIDVTSQRVTQGAAAAASLAQSGYNPASSSDNTKLVTAIAGGAALIPGVGPLIGAAVMGLYAVGSAVACPTEQFFASVGLSTLPPQCGGSPCKSSGNWTPQGILASGAKSLPAMPNGSFAQFVVGALAQFAASAANCKGATLPPGTIVDAAVNAWNATHAGPAVRYLVPPLSQVNKGMTAYGPPTIIPTWSSVSGSTPAARAGKDPYAYYGFGPVAAVQYSTTNPPKGAGPWTPFAVAPGPSGQNIDPPRVVIVNSGALLPPPAAPPPPHKTLAFRLGPPPSKPAAKGSALSPAVVVVGGGALAVGALAVFKPKLLASLLRGLRL